MESTLLRYRPQLESTAWFRSLPVELRDYLVSHATLLRLEKGEVLYRYGDPSYGLYAVLEGALAVGTVGADGKEALLAVLGPTAWVGEISMFDGLPRPHDAIAATRALFMHVPEAALQSLLDTTPRYWRDFALLMAQRLRVSFKNAESLTLLPAAQRVASRLLMIAEGYDGLNATQSKIRLSQDSLASMVSLTRQTTNQLLKNLESQGIVSLKFGEINILDIERLRAACAGVSRP
ncbi:Crp/Fnr family transcriptional regulator [Paraburkholderia sp. LEh10]|jgi:CRP-like cAMP-binding protein|uniref:Crp/Fnr family transcriptional regulator n=1 Tax=Paraburkholderia sp. LEh10 TaxID=2821353 RepID=UPI001AEAAAE9|nr:Crp/Fnr family transcriptional regulator [Paraburkholderia sp. LEh10]MBP0590690.1 Crp/Fnr family transcriptional regulator [Paraburkholderia sp. LEh10]